MKVLFKHWILKRKILCKYCSAVESHECYIRNNFKSIEEIKPDECVLAVCSVCEGKQTFFAKDFNGIGSKETEEFSCKILSKSRVVANDWLYIPGEPRPGKVKSIFRVNPNADDTAIEEIYTIEYLSGDQAKIKVPIYNISGPAAVRTYKLLPYQVGHTKIGDYVYHVIRKKVGLAVGVIHDKEEKLVLQLEDKSILILVRAKHEDQSDNKSLSRHVINAIRNINSVSEVSIETKDIKVKVSQQVAFISGICYSLRDKEFLRHFVDTVEGIKGVVCIVRVTPKVEVADAILEKKIHEILFDKKSGAFGVCLAVQNQVAKLKGYIKDQSSMDAIFSLLINIEGLRDLDLDLEVRYQQSFEEMEKSRRIVEALLKHDVNNARIIVTSVDGVTFLEGTVDSTPQKHKAMVIAMFAVKNFSKVENNLVVQKNFIGETFIKIG